MQIKDLKVLNVSINEDEYNYSGVFTLKAHKLQESFQITDLDIEDKLKEIKAVYNLSETIEIIKEQLKEMIYAQLSKPIRISQGEFYQEEKVKIRVVTDLDMA